MDREVCFWQAPDEYAITHHKRCILLTAHRTADEAPIRKKPDDFKDLGTIKVTCSWGRMVSNIVPSAIKSSKAHVETTIPEKCLKGAAKSVQAK